MGRILAIDYGSKRIGLAITDPMQIFASPLNTVSPKEFDNFIENYLKTEEVDAFVIGYPLQMNNLKRLFILPMKDSHRKWLSGQ
jgi:putative Holliday junction resolvase